MRLVFLKQNGQKLTLDHFKGYFSTVTGSGWEARYLRHDIFSSARSRHRNR